MFCVKKQSLMNIWNEKNKVRESCTKETLKLESQFQRKVQLSFDRGPFIKDAIIKGIKGEGFPKSTFVYTEPGVGGGGYNNT